jgi:hypothetical protein
VATVSLPVPRIQRVTFALLTPYFLTPYFLEPAISCRTTPIDGIAAGVSVIYKSAFRERV